MTRFSDVRGRDRALCAFYGLFSVAGCLVMGAMAVTYLVRHREDGLLGVVREFIREALTNLASRFIYADLTLVWIALAAFMIVEARRLGIRHTWAYIVGAPVLALCVSFPLFMLVRQLRIARTPASGSGPGAETSSAPSAAVHEATARTGGTQR
ncbi:DUF2834 domain-containing protein [Streptomyces spirodelae]|uniref:DUF2834 domain-containing protein n=1 Tax=Streptomyces spirodelae TaxID=2812904 RepID=A0ABS3WXW4_9ACTN|nr:DUF2834 domain-containing protein [Streptomyces spirodelae]MBO8187701.1 DUF2834 domain-containing protein [Streptomyces spirodelae]